MGANYLADYTTGFSGDDLRRLTAELAYAQFRKFKVISIFIYLQAFLTEHQQKAPKYAITSD